METEYSVDEVFDCLYDRFPKRTIEDIADKADSEAVKVATGSSFRLFIVQELNAATHVQYREVPFPWYV